MGRAVAVVLVFEEGEVSGLVEDDDRSVFEVVVVVVSFLPSPSLLLNRKGTAFALSWNADGRGTGCGCEFMVNRTFEEDDLAFVFSYWGTYVPTNVEDAKVL